MTVEMSVIHNFWYCDDKEDLPFMKILLEKGVSINTKSFANEYTALAQAICWRKEQSACLLLDYGVDLEAR